jgi:hypothetical protein
VVRVPGYRSRGPGSIPGATGFSEKRLVLERSPLSLVSTILVLLERKCSGYRLENREYSCRDPLCWPHNTPAKVGTNFADKRRSLNIVGMQTEAMEFVPDGVCSATYQQSVGGKQYCVPGSDTIYLQYCKWILMFCRNMLKWMWLRCGKVMYAGCKSMGGGERERER